MKDPELERKTTRSIVKKFNYHVKLLNGYCSMTELTKEEMNDLNYMIEMAENNKSWGE